MAMGLIVPIGVGIIIQNTIKISNVITFVLYAFIYTVVYCLSTWFISMNQYEKNLVLIPIKSILRRGK